MRKNLICLLFLIFSVIVVYAQTGAGDGWNGSVAEKFAGGTGEALDPYLISDAAQLAKLAADVNSGNTYKDKFFQLAADIVLNKDVGKYSGERKNYWKPVGNSETPFMGNFDGQGHTVSGICVQDKHGCQSLFGYLGKGGIIQNLGVINSLIDGNGYFRGICYYNDCGSIVCCYTLNCMLENDD